MPGRWAEARPPSRKELSATMIVAFPLDEASVKVNDGPPDSDPDDEGWSPWTGVLPLALRPSAPESLDGVPVPDYVIGRIR